VAEEVTGGCQCKRVRYAVGIDSDDAYLCHCGMCRRATGGVSIAFTNVRKADLRWTAAEPDYYASSPIARRGFCAACGTPLTFEYPGGDNIDLTIGSFDDPSIFVPREHFAIESALSVWLDTSGLPGKRLDQNPATIERWVAATGALPK
jgi:hypothetical protein